MARAWVTGARGFIGRHLCRHLAKQGNAVCGIGHGLWAEAAEWGLEAWINGDIDAANLELLSRLGGRPEFVFHLAGGSAVGSSLASPLEDFMRSVATSARLLDWLRLSAPEAKLVVASSAAVYGTGWDGPIPDTAPTQPYSPYGHHKLMMEQLCRSYTESFGLRCTIVRLFSVYGPWLQKQLLWDLCARIARGEAPLILGGTGREMRDWTEIEDVVRLLDLAARTERGPAEPLNGGSGVGTPVSEVAARVAVAWGHTELIRFSGIGRPGDPFSLVADASTLCALGHAWEVPLTQGIERYVSWFRSHWR